MSIRKLTIYLRDNGLDLIKILFKKRKLTFKDFYDWFNVPQNGKKIYVERMIERLLNADIIEYEELNKVYQLSQNATDKVVKFVNIGRIRFGLIYHYERELFSPQKLYDFTDLYDRHPFFDTLQYLIGENLAQFQFWQQIGNKRGQLLCYIRAELYYNEVIKSKTEIRGVYSSSSGTYDIYDEILKNTHFTKSEGYSELRNHFQICITQRCSTCGGNILNLIHLYIKKVKSEIRNSPQYDSFIQKFTKLPYRKVKEYKELKSLDYEANKLIPLNDKAFGKERREAIRSNLNSELRSRIIELRATHFELSKIRKEYRITRRKKRLIFPQIETIRAFSKAAENLFLLLKPSKILDELDSKICIKFPIDKNLFKNYNRIIRKLGKEGEKRVYNALVELYQDNPKKNPIWENAEKESGNHYDILVSNSTGKDEFIEVKTTHTDQKIFEMSEEEIKFALENSDNYKLYLLVNFGSGPDSYKIIIDNFKEVFGKNLRTTSRRLIFE